MSRKQSKNRIAVAQQTALNRLCRAYMQEFHKGTYDCFRRELGMDHGLGLNEDPRLAEIYQKALREAGLEDPRKTRDS